MKKLINKLKFFYNYLRYGQNVIKQDQLILDKLIAIETLLSFTLLDMTNYDITEPLTYLMTQCKINRIRHCRAMIEKCAIDGKVSYKEYQLVIRCLDYEGPIQGSFHGILY